MAQSYEEKAVQSIKDPTARKKEFYKRQRETAEEGQDYKTSDKINAKLGKKTTRDSWNEPQDRAENDFGLALSALPLGKVAEAGGAIRSAAGKLIPKAEEAGTALANRASQWLGKATPVKRALTSEKRALTSEKTGTKALTNAKPKVYDVKGGGTTKPGASKATKWDNVKPEGKDLKPSGRAASSPAKRMTPDSSRYNPKTGKPVGKPGNVIREDAAYRNYKNVVKANDTAESGRMNTQAARLNPRSRAMRSNEALGKPGSAKKGGYKPAKLKPVSANPRGRMGTAGEQFDKIMGIK